MSAERDENRVLPQEAFEFRPALGIDHRHQALQGGIARLQALQRLQESRRQDADFG